MPTITKINAISPASVRKIRTAAYCRVSTDAEAQLNSLDNQKRHYENYIKANSEWEYAGLYFDEGLTGTKMENRSGLQDLLRACEQRKVDLIITKSISRFARNTAGCLKIVRKLRNMGIFIHFEREGIHTGSMDGELLLSVLSSLAESESVSLSENAKWSIRAKMEAGTYKLSQAPYGYVLADGSLVPIPEQADVVKRIYAEFIAGKGTNKIAQGLDADGIPPKKCSGNWSSCSIQNILVNEKYIGDSCLQKTVSYNFKRKVNCGEEDQIYIENNHPAIISRENFARAQEVLEQRRKSVNSAKGSLKYSKKYTLSGKIRCASCGKLFKRFSRPSKSCGQTVDWRCDTKRTYGAKACSMPFYQEESIHAAFVEAMRKLATDENVLLKSHIANLRSQDDGERERQISELENLIQCNAERAQNLTGFLSKGYLTPALFKEQMNELDIEAARHKEDKVALEMSDSSELHEAEKLHNLLAKNNIIAFDDGIFSEFVTNITVHANSEAIVHFKCGLDVNAPLIWFRRSKNGVVPGGIRQKPKFKGGENHHG
ncbi:MAG: recombinase family protein [Defluviitaleaceae bacterium]|nr:recombinase family protein [Defluviitaleaceae bacterium]